MSQAPELRVLRDWPAFEAVASDWSALHDRVAGALYSSRHWLAAIREGFGLPGAMAFVTLWLDGRMVAAAPLVEVSERVSKLAPFYRPPVMRLMACRYTGFVEMLAESDALRGRLTEAVHKVAQGRPLVLDPLREDGTSDQVLTVLDACGRAIRRRRHFHSVTIPDRRSSAEHLAQRSAGFRKTLRKAQRRLEAMGGQFDEVRDLGPEVLARLNAVSARSWKSSAGSSFAADPANAAFIAALGRRMAADTVLLHIDGVDLAFATSVRCGRRDFMLWTEFDESVADLSPGRLVVWELICCVLDRRDHLATQDLVRRTHFTAEMAGDAYALIAARALPRHGLARYLDSAETALRALAGGRHLTGRKTTRRADTLPPGGQG